MSSINIIIVKAVKKSSFSSVPSKKFKILMKLLMMRSSHRAIQLPHGIFKAPVVAGSESFASHDFGKNPT